MHKPRSGTNERKIHPNASRMVALSAGDTNLPGTCSVLFGLRLSCTNSAAIQIKEGVGCASWKTERSHQHEANGSCGLAAVRLSAIGSNRACRQGNQ